MTRLKASSTCRGVALASAAFMLVFASAAVAQKVGAPAPNFHAVDSKGANQSLEQYRGKFVVLEWTNRDCPYTKKQYDSGNMQKLQKQWGSKGVVWLTVLSSAKGQEGSLTGPEENAWMAKVGAAPHSAILDPTGALGHLYQAKTTPDMYIVDAAGRLVYSGAIDDKPTTDVADVKGANNYVSDALKAAMARQTVQPDHTRPYGCNVKYGE